MNNISDISGQIAKVGYFMSCIDVEESGRLSFDWDAKRPASVPASDLFARAFAAFMGDEALHHRGNDESVGARKLAEWCGVDAAGFVEVAIGRQPEVLSAISGIGVRAREKTQPLCKAVDPGWSLLHNKAEEVRDRLQGGGRWADMYLDAPRTQGTIGNHIDMVMAASVPENVPMSEIDAFLSTEAGLAAYEKALSDSYQAVGETPLSNLYEVARTAIAQARADALKEHLPDVLMLGALKTIAREGGVAVDDSFVEALQENYADISPDMPEKAASEALTGAYEYVEPYDVPGLPLPMQVCGVMTESDLVFVACERANARRAEEQAARKPVPAKEQSKRRPAAAEREARSAASKEPRQQARELARAR